MLTDDQRKRLEPWVLAVVPRALAYARSLVRNSSQAEDVVQECLYRLLRRIDHYDLQRDGLKLLFKSISNLCINHATREKALLSLDSDGEADDRPIPVPDDSAMQPDRVLQLRELQAQIDQALQKLTPMQRAAIELRSLGLSKEEIGAALNVSTTNAGVLVYRARQFLAGELGLTRTDEPNVDV